MGILSGSPITTGAKASNDAAPGWSDEGQARWLELLTRPWACPPSDQPGAACLIMIMRLDDVAMDEVHLRTPVSDADIARLKLGDVVYLDGILYTAREGVYRKVVDQGFGLPAGVAELTNVNFHCSPAATVRPDGSYSVEAVTATASFRFGKSMSRWFERSGSRVIVGKAGLTEAAYREWFVPYGAIYLTTVGYGLGATYGRCIKRVVDVHWLKELGIAQAMWVLEVQNLGPFLVEGDREGRSLFALANREINVRLAEVYRDLPPPALSRFGETLSREDEVV